MLGVLLAGCGIDTVVHNVNEKEANYILEVLSDHDINANKVMNNTGREVVYDVSVPVADRMNAVKVLNKFELPRRRDRGYAETFASSGLIPTSSEEKAKKLAALEGEIERQLKLVDGVLDVQVQIVLPDESALRTTKEQEPTTTASATIKYLPNANGARPISEPEVQAIVAAGVERLMPENVVVLMRQAGPAPTGGKAQATACAGLACLGAKKLMMGLVALVLIIALLGVGLIFNMVRLRSVRSRFIRLQNEIAKARRKPTEALPSSASGQSA